MFTNYSWFWVKEGYSFPVDSTVTKSLRLANHNLDESKNISLDIENCSFEDIFTLGDKETQTRLRGLDSYEMNTRFIICLVYEDNIEFDAWLYLDDQDNLCIERYEDDKRPYAIWYIMSDFYKEAIIEYLK